MSKNVHVISYLEYYTSLPTSPQFALLLKGNWGCGKSNLIKRFIEKKNEKDYIMISLYGLGSFKDIDETIFTQMHPVLGSKAMKLTGRVLKGLLKTTIKVDLDHNGKEEGSVASTLPDINLPDYLKKTENKILVFDDLERCSIPIDAVLGYINQYVEVIGQKVIIIANEDDIIEKSDVKYTLIKEKVIGKSFIINSDFDAAYPTFRNEVSNQEHKRILIEQSETIERIFNDTGYDNLRHVRQTVLEYSQFLSLLSEDAIKKRELLVHLTEIFFSLSFELKKGSIKEGDIIKFFHSDFLVGAKDTDPIKILKNKYSIFKSYYHPVNYDLLTDFFKNGIIKREILDQQIKNSSYFQDENTPDTIKLWRYFELDDSEFVNVRDRVIAKFRVHSFENQYELAHVVGILISLRLNKLLNLTYTEILSIAKSCCLTLKSQNKIMSNKFEFLLGDNYNSMGFQNRNHKTFVEFKAFLDVTTEEYRDIQYNKEAEIFFQALKDNFDTAWQKLIFSNYAASYCDVPILKYLKPKDVFELIQSLSNKNKTLFSQIIDERYKTAHFNVKLKEEKKILIGIKRKLNGNKQKAKGKISGLLLEKQLLISLDKAINNL